MRPVYNVTARTSVKVNIDPCDIARILNEERERVAGGRDYYISSDGTIMNGGGRWAEKEGDATEEQARLYDALELCADYFNRMEIKL